MIVQTSAKNENELMNQWTTAGWFAGRGKLTIAYIPERQEPELMYKLFDKVCCSINELINALK